MITKQTVLVLGEDRHVRTQILRLVAGSEAANADSADAPAAVILGCQASIPKQDLETARSLASMAGGIPVVLFTAAGSESLAIEAMRAGILNYFRLPETSAGFDEALAIAIPRAAPIVRAQPVDRMIGESKVIPHLKNYLVRAAACSSNVLITGETGCGKELAAELIHQYSDRAARPMVTVNCAAIPDSLFESELFGFERGAFTGAYAAQDGKLKLADQGTVFLDEIGDLTPYAQAKLLRAIESGEIQRLGGRKAQRVDIRVIAATNRTLESDPHFRKDLFFRLNVAQVHLPPLRERREDILAIAEMFRREFDRKFGRNTTGFTFAARELMLTHAWPGNIRELRNVIESAFIDLARDASEVAMPAQFCKAVEAARGESRDELERILLTLSETHWNKSRAAERLHWSRMTLYRKMAQYQIRSAAGNAS